MKPTIILWEWLRKGASCFKKWNSKVIESFHCCRIKESVVNLRENIFSVIICPPLCFWQVKICSCALLLFGEHAAEFYCQHEKV